jgi:hypothetical protein
VHREEPAHVADVVSQQLLGHLLGALDDDEQQWVEARLERDVEYCRQWAQWRRRLAPLEAIRPDFEPPPGLVARTCRYVADYKSAMAASSPSRRALSPVPAPPSWIAQAGWADVSVAVLLFVAAAVLLLPAIQNSRFHARLAACQDNMQQFGAALTQYGNQHGSPLAELAGNGRLNAAGLFASRLVNDGFLADSRRTICPDAWLAVQGGLRTVATDERDVVGATASTLPAKLALLSDAPGADAPGQILDSHGGRGRNVLFEDGRVDFLPCSASREPAEFFIADGKAQPAAGISAPSIW